MLLTEQEMAEFLQKHMNAWVEVLKLRTYGKSLRSMPIQGMVIEDLFEHILDLFNIRIIDGDEGSCLYYEGAAIFRYDTGDHAWKPVSHWFFGEMQLSEAVFSDLLLSLLSIWTHVIAIQYEAEQLSDVFIHASCSNIAGMMHTIMHFLGTGIRAEQKDLYLVYDQKKIFFFDGTTIAWKPVLA